MIKKLFVFFKNPFAYSKKYIDGALKWVSSFALKTGFYLQGQMDINPKSSWYNKNLCEQWGGFFLPNDTIQRHIVEVEPWDLVRRDMIILLLRSLIERQIKGDLAELGVWKGYTAKLIHYYLPERTLHLFDTFKGFDKRDLDRESKIIGQQIDDRDFSDSSVDAVLKYISPQNDTVKIHAGFFPSSIPMELRDSAFSFVHLDADLYDPIFAGLQFFYEHTTPGGIILVHDFNAWSGARKAVTDFFSDKKEIIIPMPDKSGSALILKL